MDKLHSADPRSCTWNAAALARALLASILIAAIGCSSSDTPSTDATPPSVKPDEGTSASKGREGATLTKVSPEQIPLDDPTSLQPVSMAAAVFPAEAESGQTVTVAIRIKTAPGWHIYAVDRPTGVSIPTKFELTMPAGFEAVGQWDLPEPEPGPSDLGPTFLYHGDLLFRHQVKVTGATGPGTQEFGCRVGYQACTDVNCLPPTSSDLVTAVKITQP